MSSSKIQTRNNLQSNNKFAIDRILSKKVVNNQNLYLIKWQGFHHKYNTWEPQAKQLQEAIKQYQQKIQKSKSKMQSKQKKSKSKQNKKVNMQDPQINNTGENKQDNMILDPPCLNIQHSQNQQNIEVKDFRQQSDKILNNFSKFFFPLDQNKELITQLGKNQILEIVTHRTNLKEREYLVRWKSVNGLTPKDSYIKSVELIQYAPIKILEYYEDNYEDLFQRK